MPDLDEIMTVATNTKADSFLLYLSNASKEALIRGTRYHYATGSTMHDYVVGTTRALYSGQQHHENTQLMKSRESHAATYFRAYRVMLDRHNKRVWTVVNKGRL